MRSRSSHRGLTLVEVLIVVALIALLAGTVTLGPGVMRSTRLRSAATLIVSAVRTGLKRANSSGRPVRLVLDFEARRVWLEEANQRSFAREKGAVAGGAEAEGEAEKKAREEAESILDGPRPPRARFSPVNELVDPDDPEQGRDLGDGVELVQFQSGHEEQAVTHGRAYLYFWPGGATERAIVQLDTSDRQGGLTVKISALTGRASIEPGRVDLPQERSDPEADGFSERDEE